MRPNAGITVAAATAAATVCLAGRAASGQDVAVDRDTRVRSVSFRVAGGPLPPDLAAHVATQGRPARGVVDRLVRRISPLDDASGRLFDPFELQRDRERVRRHYARIGYPRAAVAYEVRRDSRENVVDVTFRITAGPPLSVSAVLFAWDSAGPHPGGRGGDPFAAPAPIAEVRVGQPLDQRAVASTVAALAAWYEDRGYAFAAVAPELAVDTAAGRATVTFRTTAGPRARIGAIRIDGNRAVATDAIRELLVVRPGDWYSRAQLRAAGQRLTELEAVSRATVERAPADSGDSSVALVVRVLELPPRRATGQAGYTTDGGLAGGATWAHGNLLGRAQTLTVDVTGQSGVLAYGQNVDKFVRGTVTAGFPVRGRTDRALNVGPYVEYRNDRRDRSLEAGAATTFLYRLGALSSVALGHRVAVRQVYEYRFGDISGGLDVLELLRLGANGILDSLGTQIRTHTASVSATLGELDVPTDPERGLVFEPTLTATIPGALTSADYVVGAFRSSAYLPVNRWLTLAVRLGGGKVLPYGKSIPATPDDGLRQFLRLRDVVFTAGGTPDVRGWARGMMGPKFPQFILASGPDSASFTAERYVALGGLNLLHGSVELRAPLPIPGRRLSVHTFVDAGRVWTRDERFTSPDDPYGVERLFAATGAGINYVTPLGAVRVELGYKLNPSTLDVADAGDVGEALLRGRPLESLPRYSSRRFRLHIGLGRRL